MYIPTGFTEEQVIQEVNKAVYLMKCFKFGFHEIKDIYQQGWIFALEVLDKFNPDLHVPLHKFLIIHLRNRFLNMQRNKVRRRQSPCLCCPYYQKRKKTCRAFDHEEDCDRLTQWNKRNSSKQSLMSTKEYVGDTLFHELNPLDNMISKEQIEFLNARIPNELRNDYRRLLDGSSLPKIKKDRLFQLIKDILEEYNVN
jgi:DNA-directed RNA polymerase specialized sigma24 family protein